ncbi:SulP family inorganic anion transporter [Halosimplex amylolyticum]|uniref:SulP family inorganic anion transporter n=1 Tax=Halosimplex amylolyticum TaxID=3396616 RepID=UPI003F574E47
MVDLETGVVQRLRSRIPLIELVTGYRREYLTDDLLAGATLWAMLVPQALAYASLAGVPPVVGLYTALGSMAMYAVFGHSRQLNVGPEGTVALLVAAIVSPLAGGDPGQYLVFTSALAIFVGLFSILGGILELGWITRFLSRPVLIGYIFGSAIIIATGQLDRLLGIDAPTLVATVWALDELNVWALAVGTLTVLVVLLARRFGPRIPAYLIGMTVATIVVAVGDLTTRGVAIVGDIRPGLPALGVPTLAVADLWSLLGPALAVALLMYVDSLLTEQSLAQRNEYDVDADQEFFGLGAANVGSGLVGGFPVNGSQSRSIVNDAARAKTQLSNLVALGLVVLTLLYLTPLFRTLPRAALAGVLLVAATELVDVTEFRRVRRINRFDFRLALVTAALVVFVGVLVGILVAVVLSLFDAAVKPYQPNTAELIRVPGTDRFRSAESVPDGESVPGLIIYRFDAQLYFANAEVLTDEVLELVESAEPPAQEVMLSAGAIIDIDSTAHQTLHDLVDELHERGIRFTVARGKPLFLETLERSGLREEIDAFYLEVDTGVTAFQRRNEDEDPPE